MTTTASDDSAFVDPSCPVFTGARLVQSFPRHETIKLDEGTFVPWQQHIRLIVEGCDLTGFLDGTLPIPPRFVQSSEGLLVPNPDASTFVQQDSYINLYGKYPPGLFAAECREGKQGLKCPKSAPTR